MKRENKYGTNKTIRFHGRCLQTLFSWYSSEQLSLEKRNRWKLMDLLKKNIQSFDCTDKIVVRRNYKFYQYNGYKNELRKNPPRHLSFPSRPDFIYQPYVNFIKVNQNIFDSALHYGWKFLKNKNNLEHLFDISMHNISLTLIYFLDGPKHFYPSDWFNAHRHAFDGYFADYSTVCSGDYCPFGPKIRGQQTSDSRIKHVIFIIEQNNKLERYGICSCHRKRSKKSDRHEYKRGRSKVKIQRREKYILTRNARTA